MIQLTCDNCEKTIGLDERPESGKAACPHCGDINRVPVGAASVPAHDHTPPHHDRAVEAGYPPDTGPEQRVMRVRRCWFRSRPAVFSFVVLIILASVVGAILALMSVIAAWLVIPLVIVALLGLAVLGWWWIERFTASIEITNKRTIETRGLLSRSTSEVVHDNIRNVQVDQTFWQRVWKAGRLGLSSSGQDGVEIQINHLPNPDELRKVIDLYRPL